MIKYDSKNQNLVNAMINLGLKMSNKGFQYILDAIDIINKYNEMPKQMYLYEKIARVNNTTASRVERGIRHEIEIYYNTFNNIPKELIPNTDTGKLTCKEFITKLVYMFNRDNIL